MKIFAYATAINQLKLDKKSLLNQNIAYDKIPQWVKSEDFLKLFLPYVEIVIDSREQDKFIESACNFFGIKNELAKKDKKAQTENLKEGDISFKVMFGEKVYDFVGVCVWERKGSANEWYNNIMGDRDRLNREMQRQIDKGYKKFVLMLEIGNCLYDLIDYEFYYYNHYGERVNKTLGMHAFSTICSWKQSNHFDIEILQVDTQKGTKDERFKARTKLFFLMLYDMFYYFRNELRKECIEKELIENEI